MNAEQGRILPPSNDRSGLHDQTVHLVAIFAAGRKLLGGAELDVAKPVVVLVREPAQRRALERVDLGRLAVAREGERRGIVAADGERGDHALVAGDALYRASLRGDLRDVLRAIVLLEHENRRAIRGPRGLDHLSV